MRSQAWKATKILLQSSDDIAQLSVESHPSDRAFETLELLIKAAWSMAKSTSHTMLADHLLKTVR